MDSSEPCIIVIVGPTAVGKSDLALKIAKKFNTDIISADSRQFYRELNIGTAKPAKDDLERIKHHFINSHSIFETVSAGIFGKESRLLLDALFEEKRIVTLVGGSGMYIDALLKGFDDIPEVPEEVRSGLNKVLEDKGLGYMQRLLEEKDSDYYQSIDIKNPQRVIRALEVIEFTGKTFSSFLHDKQSSVGNFRLIKIGLEMDRELLYDRINQRMDRMISGGLFDEVEALVQHKNLYALQTVGYTEIFDFLEGHYDKEEAIRLMKRNSRRYAKRQMTWFKRDLEIKWFKPDQTDEIYQFIEISMMADNDKKQSR